MNETVFREKSLQKVKSPDNLSEYIRVANPGIWVLLAAVLFFLLGLCCWGIFGSVRTIVYTDAHCEAGQFLCHLTDDEAAKIEPGMPVTLEGLTGTVDELRVVSGGKSTCTLTIDGSLPDGLYEAQILVESLRPVSLLLN